MSMLVRVNGRDAAVPAGWKLADLVASLGFAGKRIAVEVNGRIVPKGRYADTGLSGHDRVEIVVAVGGG